MNNETGNTNEDALCPLMYRKDYTGCKDCAKKNNFPFESCCLLECNMHVFCTDDCNSRRK